MITYADENLFKQDSVAKELSITGTGISITNSNMDGESFSIEEVLNSGRDLTFGECNAAKLSFSVGYYENSMVGKVLTASTTPSGGSAFQFGKYKVASDEPTADRKWRDVVAYDALYEVLKKDVASWYNTLLPNANSSCTLKQFRDSFFTAVGITQATVTLPNDSMTVTRTVDPKSMTGKTVLNAICEVNGRFGRIGRNGNFQYVKPDIPESGLFPKETLYPSETLYPKPYGFEKKYNDETELSKLFPAETLYPSDTLYPKEYHEKSDEYEGKYISCKFEDFITQIIDKVLILKSDDQIGGEAGTGNNVYIIKNNFLLFDKTNTELGTIAATIYGEINGIWYRPCQIEAVGNPCLECGDGIRVRTTDGIDIDTIIWKRKIKGIQSLRDSITADGLKTRENDGNTINEQIVQIKGNIRKVEADIIETNLLIAQEIQADRARIGSLEADHVSVADLQATNAKFNNLNADNITAGTLSVDRLNINSLLLSFAGKAIGCDTLYAGTVRAVTVLQLREASQTVYHNCFLNTLTIDGVTFNYVGWS